MASLKGELHKLALAKIENQISVLQEAIQSAKAAAEEETKSSAGDKYETGRAMMQLELEKFSAQLGESLKTKNALLALRPETHSKGRAGSLVFTNHGNFYLSVNAGTLSVDGETFQTLSTASPLGAKLIGVSTGDQFVFMSKTYTVERVA